MEVTDRTLFPDDVCNPAKFHSTEQAFVIKNVGKTPRGAGFVTDPHTGEWSHPELQLPVQVRAMRVTLQRFWDDIQRDPEMQDVILRHFTANLEFHRRTALVRAEHNGHIDWAEHGVGLGEGQSPTVSMFAFPLKAKVAPPKGNLATDLLEALAKGEDIPLQGQDLVAAVAEADEQEQENFDQFIGEEPEPDEHKPEIVMACSWCDFVPEEGKDPKRSLDAHVRFKHPEMKAQYDLVNQMTTEPEQAPA